MAVKKMILEIRVVRNGSKNASKNTFNSREWSFSTNDSQKNGFRNGGDSRNGARNAS